MDFLTTIILWGILIATLKKWGPTPTELLISMSNQPTVNIEWKDNRLAEDYTKR